MEKKRIEWIDIAKGITILLVIVGHCETNKIIRGIIFSFHMPLFFILSSLTMRLSCNVDEFFSQIKKSFFHLIVPAFLIFLFRSIVDIILNRDNARSIVMSVPKQYFVEKISTFIAGSGVLVKMKNISIPALGIPWFLLVLFCAKLIFDYIHLKFPKKIFILSVCLCSVLGIYCSKIQWLPFSFDIALAIQIFFLFGFLLRKVKLNEKYSFITVVALIVWIITFFVIFDFKNTYLELAQRKYPMFPLCYFCAFSGTVFVSGISTILLKLKLFSVPIRFIGKNSMTMFWVHCFDRYYASFYNIVDNNYVRMILRIFLDVVIFGIIILIKRKCKHNLK